MNKSNDPRDCCTRCGNNGHSRSSCPVWRGIFTALIGGAA